MSAETKNQDNSDSPESHDFRAVRLGKVDRLREMGVEPYPHKYNPTHTTGGLQATYESLADGEATEDTVCVAGRIMSIRNKGMFIDLKDNEGRIQVFCHKQDLDEKQLEIVGLLDQGDLIGAVGYVRRTPRGELTINATEVTVLSKSLLPLPDDYYGVQDIEMRYRQRYLDLIMNDESRDKLILRSRIISEIRSFLDADGWLEVETPMLHPIPGGAAAKPFVTHHNTLDQDMFLRIAPELYLKRLMVGGLSHKLYEINRNFRNEGISVRHNPEFTMLESYQAFIDCGQVMTNVENMVIHVIQKIIGQTTLKFEGREIDFAGPWARKPMAELVKEETGVDFLELETEEEARTAAKKIGVHVDKKATWGRCLVEVFEEKVEENLISPTFVTDYPKDMSPLSKVHPDNTRLADRFELFING